MRDLWALDITGLPSKGARHLETLLGRAREARDYRYLASLPDYLLEDIGVTRMDLANLPGAQVPRSQVADAVGQPPTSTPTSDIGNPHSVPPLDSGKIRRHRINLLRVLGLAAIAVCLLTTPSSSLAEWKTVALDLLGAALIVSAVIGRLWAIQHVGGRKSISVVRSGPYMLCRHPLYFFSLIGVGGFCVMEGSVMIGCALFGLALIIFGLTARAEEDFLREQFAEEYKQYAASTPMLFPKLTETVRASGEISVNEATMLRNLRDALVFLSTIPLSEALEITDELALIPTIPIL
ncbi:methyltransferase family protein [Jannaschia formosa]|uniref:methyltransferase family protein n=1 Tax=Jannaschia formosa TaxID=2259592 RepID=UPI001430D3A2|nr:isoprenylcysteine carboxylmethyltransferase family protein [Jannaschia formosa]